MSQGEFVKGQFIKIRLVAFILSSLVLAACQAGKEAQYPSGSVRVRVPQYSKGQVSMTPVVLNSIEDLSSLTGGAARFLLSPSDQHGKLEGLSPRIQTVRLSDGDYLATDTFSLSLLTLYASIEKLAEFDSQVGAGGLLTYPMTVAIRARIKPRHGSGFERDQAMYSEKTDALIFSPSKNASLPLAMNSGVIAHEHFHALYAKIIMNKAKQKILSGEEASLSPHDEEADGGREAVSRRTQWSEKNCKKINDSSDRDLYHRALLRGINEGLADVWGFLFSSDLDFVSRSLPGQEPRNFSRKALKLRSKESFKSNVLTFRSCEGDPGAVVYELGTEIAYPIVQFTLEQIKKDNLTWDESRKQTAAALIRTLHAFAARVDQAVDSKDLELEPKDIHELFAQEVKGFNVQQDD